MPRDADYMNGEMPNGTLLLRNQYRIERRLIDGGFGITYLARDSLDRRVVIKECFPAEISCRAEGQVMASAPEYREVFSAILRQFQSEARRMAALKHPNIVNVHQIFEENGTAYMAMEFVDGLDLMTIAETDPERFRPELVQDVLKQSLEAIAYTHSQGMLHRDVAPDNLLLSEEDHLTLIDFGSAFDERVDPSGVHSKLLSVKDGFSPHEFYTEDETQGEFSDLYSLGATFHFVITGSAPPNALERFEAVMAGDPDPYTKLSDGAWNYQESFLASIDHALMIAQECRVQTAAQWLEQLQGDVVEDADAVADAVRSFPIAEISEEEIYRLVNDTNMRLTPGQPTAEDAREEKAKADASANADTNTKQWVDIFGEPIKDIEAFMRDQDKKNSSQKKSGSGLDTKLVAQIQPPNEQQKKWQLPVLGKFFGKRSRPKDDPTKSAFVQT